MFWSQNRQTIGINPANLTFHELFDRLLADERGREHGFSDEADLRFTVGKGLYLKDGVDRSWFGNWHRRSRKFLEASQLVVDAIDIEFPDVDRAQFNGMSLGQYVVQKVCVKDGTYGRRLNIKSLKQALDEVSAIRRAQEDASVIGKEAPAPQPTNEMRLPGQEISPPLAPSRALALDDVSKKQTAIVTSRLVQSEASQQAGYKLIDEAISADLRAHLKADPANKQKLADLLFTIGGSDVIGQPSPLSRYLKKGIDPTLGLSGANLHYVAQALESLGVTSHPRVSYLISVLDVRRQILASAQLIAETHKSIERFFATERGETEREKKKDRALKEEMKQHYQAYMDETAEKTTAFLNDELLKIPFPGGLIDYENQRRLYHTLVELFKDTPRPIPPIIDKHDALGRRLARAPFMMFHLKQSLCALMQNNPYKDFSDDVDGNKEPTDEFNDGMDSILHVSEKVSLARGERWFVELNKPALFGGFTLSIPRSLHSETEAHSAMPIDAVRDMYLNLLEEINDIKIDVNSVIADGEKRETYFSKVKQALKLSDRLLMFYQRNQMMSGAHNDKNPNDRRYAEISRDLKKVSDRHYGLLMDEIHYRFLNIRHPLPKRSDRTSSSQRSSLTDEQTQ